jgi:hypothetical protein
MMFYNMQSELILDHVNVALYWSEIFPKTVHQNLHVCY